MNANFSKLIVAMMLVWFAGSSYAREPEAAVAVKTDGLPAHVAARVQQKAAQGVTSLRRYVWITRNMHGLDICALVREEPAPKALDAKKPIQIATRSGAR
jgi:hypothetical protein